MIPKSTAKLSEGGYCWIKRDDGKYVPFVYISKQGNSRSYFYGGLITTTIYSESTEDIPSGIEVKDYALLHIKCCRENDTPIVGNLSEKLSAGNIDRIKLDIADMSMGSK